MKLIKKFLSNFSFRGLRGKMLTIAIIPIILMVFVTIFIDSRVQILTKKMNSLITQTIPSLTTSKEISVEIGNIDRFLKACLLNKADEAILSDNISNLESAKDRMESAIERYGLLEVPDRAKLLREQAKNMSSEALVVINQALGLIKEKKFEEAQKLSSGLIIEKFSAVDSVLSNIELNNSELIESEKNQSERLSWMTRMSSIVSTGIVLLLSIVASILITKKTMQSIQSVSIELSSEAEKSRSLSSQIAENSENLSSISTSSAASIEETAASIEEINSMAQSSAQNADAASSLSKHAYDEAQIGEKEVKKLILAINEIEKSSKQITEIVNLIDDIAFQTNLLALNASVEAARAGEQGKGFAVVADAVRELAQKSASSAKDISDLIAQSSERVKLGTTLANESEASFSKIVSSIKKVFEINIESSKAAQDQSKGISQVNIAINQLDQNAQNNAQVAENISSLSSAILTQSDQIDSFVKKLDQVISG